jgi:subtilisin family serine protease/subtilisin-like proprotein convertase family protein
MTATDRTAPHGQRLTHDASKVRRWGAACALLCLLIAASTSEAQGGDSDRLLVSFRMPHPVQYQMDPGEGARLSANTGAPWIRASQPGATNSVLLGSRIAVRTAPGIDLNTLVDSTEFPVARVLAPGWYILQALNARTAILEAERLAGLPEIQISYPVMRQALRLHDTYAARPNDTYFDRQWNLENRAADGSSLGVDLNLRAAWSATRGAGVALAVVDDGIDLEHPEFATHASNDLHFNFAAGTADGRPTLSSDNHGTAVAGLAAAAWNNERGMAGVAPEAQLASWKIFSGFSLAASDEQLMDMFQYRMDVMGVQNHSWGNSGIEQLAPSPIEELGLATAITAGRQGRGVIMVRSGGNGREQMSDANDDAYASDPRVITVAAIRRDGRAADYSTPGACLLVAAPGGADDGNLFTTDRRDTSGFNTGTFPDDFADYVFSSTLQGTSFSAPQISGLAALLLSVNPELTYRDVQMILALASRHADQLDPDLTSNGAGLRVSHNVGFGIPDAGYAIDLARRWNHRPPLVEQRIPATVSINIPDDGLRVAITGTSAVPSQLASIPGTPSLGAFAAAPTAALPLVDIGLASPPVTTDLQGKAALIERGSHFFIDKIEAAASAGAAFAIIFNNVGTTERLIMAATDFAPIPALFVDRETGEALRAQLSLDPTLKAQITPVSARHTFVNLTTNTMVCEHVGLRVATTHTRRGDLRITLVSPSGTRSVLQRINNDASLGPFNWTYYSVHHFLEPSHGRWQVEITDQQPLNAGVITELELILRGIRITDTDADGLDDDWERAQFGSLSQAPRDDPDHDGQSNAIEQVLGTNATATDRPLTLDLATWNDTHFRLSWPGVEGHSYQLLGSPDQGATPDLLFVVPGRFPVTEQFLPMNGAPRNFFRLRILGPGSELERLGLPGTTHPSPTARP